MNESIKKPWQNRWWFWPLIVVFIIVVITSLGGNKTDTATTPSVKPATVGQNASINANKDTSDCSGNAIITTNDASFDALIKASVANDTNGISKLESSGDAYVVPNCSKALVIGEEVNKREVRFTDGSHKDQTGWVPMEYAVLVSN